MKRFCGILLFLLLLTLGGSGCGSSNKGSLSSSTTFTVTFDSNGGSKVPSVTVTSGDTVEKPADPVKEGYYFGNWFRDNGTFQNAFNFGSDKISADITLYARWLDSNDLMAEYAVGEIVIGYATGDNPKYVTQNITLPTKVDSSDISWSSSSGAISSNGTVTRQATDTDVTLTATASYNGKSASRTFELKVIKKRTRDNSKIQSLPLETASSGDISITRNESGDVVDIEGNYATFDIENADDAIDAVTVIKDELGIKNPIEELVPAVITSDEYGAEYQFQQVHNGVKVFGRGLMASANAKNNGDFLHSNLLPSDVIAKADGKNDIGKAAAENAAKSAYTGDVEIDSERTEKVIYSLEDYEKKPVYAYVVRVSGNLGEQYIDESVVINGENSNRINNFSNIYDATIWVHGPDELSSDISLSFPVTVEKQENARTYLRMHNTSTNYLPSVMVFSGDIYHPVIRELHEAWDDAHQNSAYTNMLEIMEWWRKTFNRNSLDDKGMGVVAITHEKVLNHTDNAAWWGIPQAIFFGNSSILNYSMAVAIDCITHESTHAVLQYTIGFDNAKLLLVEIQEAYADIFACYQDKNWTMFEKAFTSSAWSFDRNIENPKDERARIKGPLKLSEKADYDDVHEQSIFISRTAYLMKKNGLTWDELGRVWYKSMSMGLLGTSSYKDVRRCVVWAAQKLKYSDKQLAIIKAAFDEVEIKEQKEKFGSVHGKVQEMAAGNKAIEGAKVTAFETRLSNGKFKLKMMEQTTTKANGEYSIKLEAGNYTLSFDKDGYEELSHDVSIKSSEDIELNIGLKKANSISGVVLSKDETPLSGVTVRVFEGQSATGSELNSITTDTSGKYSISLKKNKSGYYTLKFSKSGYKTETLTVYVSGEVKDQKTYLEKNNGTGIAGTVYDSNDGTVISGVSVQLFEGGEGKTESVPVKTATTDSNGEYSFNLNENGPGDYTIVLIKPLYEKAIYTVSVNSGSITLHVAYLEEEDFPIVSIDEEHFPDANFRSYIKANFDHNNNDALSVKEIAKAANVDVRSQNIASLQGIEFLTSLQSLDCRDNRLTNLNVSGYASLRELRCSGNNFTTLNASNCSSLQLLECDNTLDIYNNKKKLTNLNLKGCTSLGSLSCGYNQLTTLDISDCITLQTLDCSGNQLAILDISNCKNLQYLDCGGNSLSILNVDSCADLLYLLCSNNLLTALDVSKCHKLQFLNCATVYSTNIETLNVNGCIALQRITCDNNKIVTLDLSDCIALQYLSCSNNKIKTLNVNNCVELHYLDCHNNQLSTLNLSSCTKLDAYYVHCDSSATITWPTTTASSMTKDSFKDLMVFASIPPFTATHTGEYVFDVSVDKEIPEDSRLILLNESEDLQGIFTIPDTESFDHVQVSANFEAGKTYSPVIAAQFEAESSGGGCNAEVSGLFALMFVSIIAKRRFR